MSNENTTTVSPPWQPFSYAVLAGSLSIHDTPESWHKEACGLVTCWGFSLDELLDLRMSQSTIFDCPHFALPGTEAWKGTGLTLREWGESVGINLVTEELRALTVDPRVGLWREMLRETLDTMRGKPESPIVWIYHDEIVQRTGHPLANGTFPLITAALRPFKPDPDFHVYQHTFNRYDGEKAEDRYFVITLREPPPGIHID